MLNGNTTSLFAAACCALILMSASFAGGYWANRITADDKNTMFQHSMATHHFRQARDLPPNTVLFLGSSSLQGLWPQHVHAMGVNLGIGAERLDQLIDRLPPKPILQSASAFIIMSGFNDLKREEPAEALKDFDALLAKLPDGKPLIVNAAQLSLGNRPALEKIRAKVPTFNEGLEARCAAIAYCRFVNVNDEFDQLGDTAYDDDGVHFSIQGYRALGQALRRELELLISAEDTTS